jgi:hypothetical protein
VVSGIFAYLFVPGARGLAWGLGNEFIPNKIQGGESTSEQVL